MKEGHLTGHKLVMTNYSTGEASDIKREMSKSLAVTAAKAAAASALGTVAMTELYCRQDHKKSFSGKHAYGQVTGEKDWKDRSVGEQLAWNMVAQLLVQRPTIKPNHPIILKEGQGEVLSRVRQSMAAVTVMKYMRAVGLRKLFPLIRQAAKTVYEIMDWGWNEKVFQEALKAELDLVMEGRLLIRSEITHTISYKGQMMGDGVNVRTDILLTEKATGRQLLLELKAVSGERSSLIKAEQQCKRYLRMKGIPVGMVINFPDKPNCQVRCSTVLP